MPVPNQPLKRTTPSHFLTSMPVPLNPSTMVTMESSNSWPALCFWGRQLMQNKPRAHIYGPYILYVQLQGPISSGLSTSLDKE